MAGVGDRFGSALAAANFGKGARSDLAVGVPFEDAGAVANAGAVNVLYGRAGGLSPRGDQVWHQNRRGVMDTAEAGDRFGLALAGADLGNATQADLAVGVPGEDVGSISNAGAVAVLYASSAGLSPSGDQIWHGDETGIPGTAEQGDALGSALAAANLGNGRRADLAAGAPPAEADAGEMSVFYGGPNGLAAAASELWRSGQSGERVRGGVRSGRLQRQRHRRSRRRRSRRRPGGRRRPDRGRRVGRRHLWSGIGPLERRRPVLAPEFRRSQGHG